MQMELVLKFRKAAMLQLAFEDNQVQEAFGGDEAYKGRLAHMELPHESEGHGASSSSSHADEAGWWKGVEHQYHSAVASLRESSMGGADAPPLIALPWSADHARPSQFDERAPLCETVFVFPQEATC